ncbi:hypothetical protein Ddye_027193 [Dipteronia dyeriana]|uniref:Uncharacterized protein n=1 Tax=Dipteronia dyeriana TaxID=168575 RepID=A0AAD9TPG0_9ROSI|nr:hypothetical protein Ddye_027193 [Dipteronia dyeriana]
MSLQVSVIASASTQSVKRHTTAYHPTIWGDHFLKYASHSMPIDAKTQEEYKELKHEVRRMIISTTSDEISKKLRLIDAIQRLGVAYHFEREIGDALEAIYNGYDDDDNNLHTAALRFRLLRQQGYSVPCDVFEKFKDDQGKFKASLLDDVAGMLCLYEAAYLGIPEEDILDEAIAFTTSHLGLMVTDDQVISHDDDDDHHHHQLVEEINHAMNRPIRKGLPRLEARYYINIYSGDESHNQILLNFAKIDFNILQVQHQKELSSITEWWKILDFATKLPYARDRVVECYFWIMGMCSEPQYSFTRITLTKITAMTSILDDTYDAFGTYEELELLTDAIQRWDIGVMDGLPEYMKYLYRALVGVYREAEEEMISKELGRSYYMPYAIEVMKRQVQAYFVEAKWCKDGYVPKVEEYMQNSLVSSAYPMIATTCFLLMGDIANQQAFDWISNYPNIIKASAIIGRLMNDIVSHEFEHKREHVATSVECYMKQHRISKEEVIKLFRKEISDAWKDINQECLKPTAAVPIPILVCILNLSRVADLVYKDGDGYTNSHILKDHISSVLLNPVLL